MTINVAGQEIPFQDVQFFVLTFLFPPVWGFVGSLLTEVFKRFGLLEFGPLWSEKARVWLMRLTVAFACVLLNVMGTLVMREALSAAVLWQAFFSYLAASTTFVHALQKPSGQPEGKQA